MFDKNLRILIEQITELAVQRCGQEFEDYMQGLMAERERLLNNVWARTPAEELDSSDTDRVLREIDFDMITLHAARYLKVSDYADFLYDVAELSLRFGQLEKAQSLLQLLIRKYAAAGGRKLTAKSHHLLGRAVFYKSEFQQATKAYEASLEIYLDLQDREGICTMQNALGIVLVSTGQVSKGVELFDSALEIAEANTYSDLIIKIQINLGNSHIIRGDWELARTAFEMALEVLGEKPNDDLRARIFHNISIVHTGQKEYSEAHNYLEKSLDYSEKTHNLYLKSLSYLEESGIKCEQGDLNSATALATTAFHTFAEMGDRVSMADAYKTFGIINRQRANYESALSFFENSKKINEDYNNYLNLGQTLLEMALLYQKLNDKTKAKELVNDAIECFKQIESDTRVSLALQTIELKH